MKKQVVTPIHLVRLPCQQVVYVPQNLQTIAIQVTRETIGAMAIEFGCEVGSAHPNYRWLAALLQRYNVKRESGFVERTLNLGDWLVVLEDEVHVFPEDVFGATFTKFEGDRHGFPEQIDESFNAVAMLPNELTENVQKLNDTLRKKQGTEFMTLPPELTHEGKWGAEKIAEVAEDVRGRGIPSSQYDENTTPDETA